MQTATSLQGFTLQMRALLGVLALLLLAGCGGAGKTATPFVPLAGGAPDTPNDVPVPDAQGGAAVPAPNPLKGGVLIQFSQFVSIGVPEDVFHAWVTDTTTIAALEAAWTGAAPAVNHIGVGLATGDGTGSHNAPWSWHVRDDLPISVNALVGVPVRVPVTGPSGVEANVSGHTGAGQRWFIYCRMTAFTDYR